MRQVDGRVLHDPLEGDALLVRAKARIGPVTIAVAIVPNIQEQAISEEAGLGGDAARDGEFEDGRGAIAHHGLLLIEPAIVAAIAVGGCRSGTRIKVGASILIGKLVGISFGAHTRAKPNDARVIVAGANRVSASKNGGEVRRNTGVGVHRQVRTVGAIGGIAKVADRRGEVRGQRRERDQAQRQAEEQDEATQEGRATLVELGMGMVRSVDGSGVHFRSPFP